MSDKESSDRRRRLDSVIPDLLKRAVEIGVEKAAEAPDSFKELVGSMKLPREAAHYLLAQVEETKDGLVSVVAKEVREFLQQASLSDEMKKLLTGVQFELHTTIRFRPSDEAGAVGQVDLSKPEVKAEMTVKRPAQNGERSDGDDAAAAGPDDRRRERRRNRD